MCVFRLVLVLLGLVLPVLAAPVLPLSSAVRSGGEVEGAVAAKLANISEGQRDKVALILENQQKRLGMCNRVAVIQPVQVVAPGEVVFGKDGQVQSGQWMVRYAVKACKLDGLRMVAFEAKDGRIAMEALVPGASLADRALQRDVLHSFALVAAKVDPACGQLPVVRSTRVVYPPSAQDKTWREAWVAAACGREIGQIITFVPTTKGTRFTMALPGK